MAKNLAGKIMRSRHGSLEEGGGEGESPEAHFQKFSSNPRRASSLPLFLRRDRFFRRQRRLLFGLQGSCGKIPFVSVIPRKKPSKEVLSSMAAIDSKVKKEISTMYDRPRKRSMTPLNKFSTMLKLKKPKKRASSEHLHLLKIAIRDKNANLAMYYASKVSQNTLKRKEQVAVNRIFLMALINGMSRVVLHLLEKGYPREVDAPAFEMVLEGGAQENVSIRCPSYFMLAISYGLEDVVNVMIRKGASLTQTWNDLSPLHVACCVFGKGSAALVNLLLECGADPSQPLEYAQFIRMKQFSHLANPSPQAKKGKRQLGAEQVKRSLQEKEELKKSFIYPLDIAVACRNRDVVALLLSRMKSQDVFNSKFCLTLRQDLEILVALLDAGANPLQKNQRGSTFVHLAARRGDCEAIRLASYFKVSLDSKGERGWTPLHEAVSTHHVLAARLLQSLGAKTDIKNDDGDDPKALALKCGILEKDLSEYFDLTQSKHLNPNEINITNLIRQYREYVPVIKQEPSITKRKFSAPDLRRISSSPEGFNNPSSSSTSSSSSSAPSSPLQSTSGESLRSGSMPQLGLTTSTGNPSSVRFVARRRSGLSNAVQGEASNPPDLNEVLLSSAIFKRLENQDKETRSSLDLSLPQQESAQKEERLEEQKEKEDKEEIEEKEGKLEEEKLEEQKEKEEKEDEEKPEEKEQRPAEQKQEEQKEKPEQEKQEKQENAS